MGKNSRQRAEALKQEMLDKEHMKELQKQGMITDLKKNYYMLMLFERQIKTGILLFKDEQPELLFLKAEQVKFAITNARMQLQNQFEMKEEELNKIHEDCRKKEGSYLYWMVD